MKYTVTAISDMGFETQIAAGVSKKNVKNIVAEMIADGEKQIYVSWFRASDGQHGYLNSDGNHAITGSNWAE